MLQLQESCRCPKNLHVQYSAKVHFVSGPMGKCQYFTHDLFMCVYWRDSPLFHIFL